MNDDLISSGNRNFASLLEAPLLYDTTRRLLRWGLGSAVLPFLGWPAFAMPAGRPAIGSAPIAPATNDAVHVLPGYPAQVLYASGDPISAGPAKPLTSPGWPASQFPELTGGRPRSATIVIRRRDGGIVGT